MRFNATADRELVASGPTSFQGFRVSGPTLLIGFFALLFGFAALVVFVVQTQRPAAKERVDAILNAPRENSPAATDNRSR